MNKEKCLGIFTDMLLSLLEKGLSISISLDILSRIELSGSSRAVPEFSGKILQEMKKGSTFSSALSFALNQKPNGSDFAPLYIPLISAAETTGSIQNVLADLNRDFTRKKSIKEKLASALIYPAAVIVIAFAGTLVILFKGIPLFISGGLASKHISRDITSGIISAGVFLVIAGILLFIFCKRLLEKESVFFRIFYILSFLSEAKLPLAHILTQCMGIIKEKAAKKALLSIKDDMSNGVNIGAAFGKTGFFPPIVTAWLTLAGEGGDARQVFEKIALYYSEKDEQFRERTLRLIEPAVIVITGIYILILVQTAILPVLTGIGGF